MSILPSLPQPMAEVLVPSGSTLADCWVVCLGDREQLSTTSDGRTIYGDVTSWIPVLPLPDKLAALAFGERMGAASLSADPDEWGWWPIGDDCPELLELYGVIDGNDARPEVAIVPLSALVAGGGQ